MCDRHASLVPKLYMGMTRMQVLYKSCPVGDGSCPVEDKSCPAGDKSCPTGDKSCRRMQVLSSDASLVVGCKSCRRVKVGRARARA